MREQSQSPCLADNLERKKKLMLYEALAFLFVPEGYTDSGGKYAKYCQTT